MDDNIPIKLGKSPLVEAIFEIRFEPSVPMAGDLLPGLLYARLKTEYSETEPLPLASIPRQIRDNQAELRYHASHRLKGKHRILQFGDRVLSLHVTEYPGWTNFKPWVESVTNSAKDTGLIKQVERFSLKYLNLIEASANEQQLSFLNSRIEINGSVPIHRGFRLRFERDDDGAFNSIIEIIPDAAGKRSSDQRAISGLLVTVDSIRDGVGSDYWDNQSRFIEECHSVVKDIFFKLITKSTLKRLEPIWT